MVDRGQRPCAENEHIRKRRTAGTEVLEGAVVRARYRGPKFIEQGVASFTLPESFSCALFVENNRVAALDANPHQVHPNRVGIRTLSSLDPLGAAKAVHI